MVSLRGQFFNWYFTRIGFKNGMAKDIKQGNRRAAEPKPAVMRRNSVEAPEFQGRKLWYIHPKGGKSHDSSKDPSKVIVFFHGGAYYYDVLDLHFAAWAKIADLSGAMVVLPSYPLAPEASPSEMSQYACDVIGKVRAEYPNVNILAGGDSAGGGLALQMCQKLAKDGDAQPEHLLLWSPWVDVSRDNPELEEQDKRSVIIGLKGSQLAAELYRGDLNPKDPRISPIYGDLTCLPSMTIVTGSRDLLHPDIMRFANKAKEAGASVDLQKWPGQNHYFMYLPQPEAMTVYRQAAELIKSI